MTRSVIQTWHMACPKCGCDDNIDINANVWVRLCPDGTDVTLADNGDHEWDAHNNAVCGSCDHHGDVAEFTRIGRPAMSGHSFNHCLRLARLHFDAEHDNPEEMAPA